MPRPAPEARVRAEWLDAEWHQGLEAMIRLAGIAADARMELTK